MLDQPDGTQKMVIRPNLSNSTRETIAGMADVYAYAHQYKPGEMSVLTLRDPSGAIECGCRFKYIENEISLNYENLVKAISTAIDKESSENGGKFVTEERVTVTEAPEYNHSELMTEFQTLAGKIMGEDEKNNIKISAIVEKYLGKGKKISETSPNQAEIVYLIINELKEAFPIA